MHLRSASLPKSPLNSRSFIRRARARLAVPALALTAGALLFTHPLARAADTEDDVLAGATDLGVNTAGTTYTATATTTSDVTFAAATTYANAGNLLLNTALSIGSLNDLNATAITINGTAALTLNVTTGGNVVASVAANGGSTADSLFVASGGSLTINDTAGINVVNSSSFDAIGTLNLGTTGINITAAKILSFTGAGATTVGGVIAATTGAVTINDAGGTTTFGGANLYTGVTTLTAGTLDLTNALALQKSTLTTGAGSLVFDASVTGNAFTFGGLAGSNNLSLLNNGTTPAAIALTVGGNNAATEGIEHAERLRKHQHVLAGLFLELVEHRAAHSLTWDEFGAERRFHLRPELVLIAGQLIDRELQIARHQHLHAVAVEPDQLTQECDRKQALARLAFLLEDDLRQHRPGDLFARFGIVDDEIIALLDHHGQVFQRHIRTRACVIQAPVCVLLDRDGLAIAGAHSSPVWRSAAGNPCASQQIGRLRPSRKGVLVGLLEKRSVSGHFEC